MNRLVAISFCWTVALCAVSYADAEELPNDEDAMEWLKIEWVESPKYGGGYSVLVTNTGFTEIAVPRLEFLSMSAADQELRGLKQLALGSTVIQPGETAYLDAQVGPLPPGETLAVRAQSERKSRLFTTPLKASSVVQVLLYGLMVFEDRGSSIVVHLPWDINHRTYLTIGEQKKGSFVWSRQKINGMSEVPKGHFIKFDFGDKKLKRDKTPVEYWNPSTETAIAELPSWLLSEKLVEGNLIGRFDRAYGHVWLEDGTFETCGLVYYPDPEDVCKVSFGKADGAMAELMVLRKKNPAKVDIQICDVKLAGGVLEPDNCTSLGITVPKYNTKCPAGYSECYEIALRHTTPGQPGRKEETLHTKVLASLFAAHTADDWEKAETYKACSSKWAQPLCFLRYKDFGGDWSANDRPICPMIEDGN